MNTLTLVRRWRTDDTTMGELYHGDIKLCYMLEDKYREIIGNSVVEWKVSGRTAIPAGRYPLIQTMSNRFKRVMPLLVGVPGFAGVRIHSGNTHEDTEGCLLVGLGHSGVRAVTDSRLAMHKIDDLLHAWQVDDHPGKAEINIICNWSDHAPL